MMKTFGGSRGVALVESTTGKHACANCFEIAGSNAVNHRGRFVAWFGKFLALDQILAGVRPIKKGVKEEMLAEATPATASRRSTVSR